MVPRQPDLLRGCRGGERAGAGDVYKCRAGAGDGAQAEIPAGERSADPYAEPGQFYADDGRNAPVAAGRQLCVYPYGY